MFVSIAMAAEEAVEGTDAATGGFPPFETAGFASQLFWLALTFGFLYWFLKEKALPKLEETLEARSARIEGDKANARRAREEAEAAEAAYTQELATARQNAGRIANDARDKATGEANAKRAAAEAELDAKLKDAEGRIAETKKAAMSHVGEIAQDVTAAILTRVANRNYTDEQIREAVREAAAAR